MMSKDDVFAERDKLAKQYNVNGDFEAGFHAAVRLMLIREKALRDELFCTNRFLKCIIGKIDHGILVDSAVADHIECNDKVLLQTEW